MRKFIGAIFILISIMIIVSVDGCYRNTKSDNTSVPVDTVNSSNESSSTPMNQIIVENVHVLDSVSIRFYGTANLSDGTLLNSQLYEDDILLSWWPANLDIMVRNENWNIVVPLGVNGAPKSLLSGPSYHLILWQKNDSSVKGFFRFDLKGPPDLSP